MNLYTVHKNRYILISGTNFCDHCDHTIKSMGLAPSVINYLHRVPSCPTCLRACVSMCLRFLRAYLFLCALRAFIFYVPSVPSFFYVPCVPSFFTCFVSSFFYMRCVPSSFYVLYVPSFFPRAYILFMYMLIKLAQIYELIYYCSSLLL